MRIVIQRVGNASVKVQGQIIGKIQQGFLILVGFQNQDNELTLQKMAEKVVHLRVFEDDQGKMNRSLLQLNEPSVLVVPQFTLYADSSMGRRPSFIRAASPQMAEPLFHRFCEWLQTYSLHVETGLFGADMQVSLTNDGPVTILLDSDELFQSVNQK
jgi:D-tyrosyl-tRNA(Tyr) deacylase